MFFEWKLIAMTEGSLRPKIWIVRLCSPALHPVAPGRAGEGDDLHVDADLLQLRLVGLGDVLEEDDVGEGPELDVEFVAVLLPDAVVADDPSGPVENRLRLLGIVGIHRLGTGPVAEGDRGEDRARRRIDPEVDRGC